MNKYLHFTKIIVYPSNQMPSQSSTQVANEMTQALEQGYEIISAVPISAHDVAGVEYILEKRA